MITLSQRLEALRTERNLSRPALAQSLGFPKNSIEKFETGRQTPTKEQQEKMSAYFGVSLFYLRGESSDRTRQDDWMDLSPSDVAEPIATSPPAPVRKATKTEPMPQGALFDSLLSSKQVQDLLKTVVLDTLRSPEGQELIARSVQKELMKRR